MPSSPVPRHQSSFASQHILITGGCGFIGINLIDHLLKMNPNVKIRVLDNLSVGTREDLSEVCTFTENASLCPQAPPPPGASAPTPLVEFVKGDIRYYETCLKSCEEIDIVIHLAASTGVPPSIENPREDMEVNVKGTFNMLEASRQKGVKKFIFASSGAPIGEVEPPIHEEKAPRPVSPYGASKLAGEGYCSAYYRTFGLKTISLRFGNVYGQRSKHKSSVVAKFFKQALAGKSIEIYGDGNQTRDFIYIDDLIQAICLAVNPMPHVYPVKSKIISPGRSAQCALPLDPWGEVFQIATYKETTVNEIADKVKELVENETGRKVNIIHGKPRVGDVRRNYSDISKARKMLGYEPEFDLDMGLKYTFEYFKKNISRLTSHI